MAKPLPKGARFAVALAVLGTVMFNLSPEAATILGVIIILGAFLSLKSDAAGPIKELSKLVYGG